MMCFLLFAQCLRICFWANRLVCRWTSCFLLTKCSFCCLQRESIFRRPFCQMLVIHLDRNPTLPLKTLGTLVLPILVGWYTESCYPLDVGSDAWEIGIRSTLQQVRPTVISTTCHFRHGHGWSMGTGEIGATWTKENNKIECGDGWYIFSKIQIQPNE